MTRKTFLKVLLGLFLILAMGGGYRYRQRLRRHLGLPPDDFAEKGTLTEPEFQVVRAVFEVISPKPAPSRDKLLEFVNWRTSSIEGYYREYKDGAALLDSKAHRQSGQGFASLEAESKEKILREILRPRTTLISRAIGRLFRGSERRFQHSVFQDLMMFYWSSGEAWGSVGYRSYRGVPSPPRAYTSAPGAATAESLT